MKESVRLVWESGARQYVLIYREDLIAPHEAERMSRGLRKFLGNAVVMRIVPHPYDAEANAAVVMTWHADLYSPDGEVLRRVAKRINGRHG